MEPDLRIEFTLRNSKNDPEFCRKSYMLEKDVNGSFRSKFDSFISFFYPQLRTKSSDLKLEIDKEMERPLISGKRLISGGGGIEQTWRNAFLATSNEDTLSSTRSSKMSNPLALLNHSIIFISVIASAIFVLVFLAGLICVRAKRKLRTK